MRYKCPKCDTTMETVVESINSDTFSLKTTF